MSPGNYELLAECADNPKLPTATYQKLFLDRDYQMTIQMSPIPTLQLSIEEKDGKTVDPRMVSVFARRKDLAEEGPPQLLKDGMTILPGRWEMIIASTGNLYPMSISIPGPENRDPGRGDTWSEFLVAVRTRVTNVKALVGTGAGAVYGTVTKSLSQPAVGAPVYLEAYDPVSQKRLADLRKMVTDTRGQYRFASLTPGSYRIVSSFEFDDPDERMMESVHATAVTVPPAGSTPQDLDLYNRP